MKKILSWLIILALLAVSGYGIYLWQQRQREAQASNLQTMAVSKGNLTATTGATGQVRSMQSALLTWKTTGVVQAVYVSVGDRVKAGDKLAELEQTSLPQAVILAQAELESAKRALDDLYTNAENAKVQAMQAIANYTQAARNAQYQLDNFTVPQNQVGLDTMEALDLMQARLDTARAAFEPYKYYPSGDPTRKELKEKLDEAQADYNTAVKRLEYEYALEVATANLEKARKDYEKWKNGPSPDEIAAAQARIAAAEATLSQAWIEAPFDGFITLATPQVGDLVSPNMSAFRLDDLSSLLVDVSVSEVDINQIQVGQPVLLTFDAIRGKEYRGNVTQVDPVGTFNQGSVDFGVTIELINADEQVRPGMTAAVNIVVNELVDVLLVPNRAVRFRDGRQVVYLLKADQIVPVTIKLGASSDTMSQVLEGDLQIGDAIILNPPQEFESNGPPPFVRRGGG